MLFLTFLKKLFHEHPRALIISSFLMAGVALTEGVIVALIVPLLNIAFQDAHVAQEGGFLQSAVDVVADVLGIFSIRPSLGIVLLIIVAIFIVQGIVKFLHMRLQWKTIKEYDLNLVHTVSEKYLKTAWPFFISQKSGHLVNSITEETARAAGAFQFTLQFLAQFFIILFYVIISFLISWKITVLGVVLGICASLFLKRFIGKMEVLGSQMSYANSEFHATAQEIFASAKMIKATATEKRALTKIDEKAQRKSHLRYVSQLNGSLIPSFYFPLVMSWLALIVYLATQYWEVNFAVILIFVYIFYRLIPALSSLHSAYEQACVYIPAFNAVFAMQGVAEQYQENDTHAGKPFSHLAYSIILKDVSLTYADKEIPALHNINLTIPKGARIAIAGVSGAGKTSLVDVLLGLFLPQKGTLLVDDVPLQAYDMSSWRKRLGYISQDVFLFHDTIRTNITWLAPNATNADIQQSLTASYADEFIATLPQGLDTIIGDRGVKLSGGQRQRIAMARLFLQNPDIVIFDEAMSALDLESEEKIKKATETLFKNKTTIIISHRLSTIHDVDSVYVLDKGSIVDQGTFAELAKKRRYFHQTQ